MSQIMLKLNYEREARGWTIREFAEKSGVTEVSMSRYISGARTPNINTIENMVKALGMKIELKKKVSHI